MLSAIQRAGSSKSPRPSFLWCAGRQRGAMLRQDIKFVLCLAVTTFPLSFRESFEALSLAQPVDQSWKPQFHGLAHYVLLG